MSSLMARRAEPLKIKWNLDGIKRHQSKEVVEASCLEVMVEFDGFFLSGSFETGEEGQGFLHNIGYVGTRHIPRRIKPSIINLLMDMEDFLVAEASILHVAGSTGEITFGNNVFCQPFDAIVTGMVLP
jgi:hypothetical protein